MTPPSGFRWFAAGVASWFGAWGMQTVLFTWLVVGELRASGEWVGVAQTSTMLPAVVLLLLGGATADRHDPRRLLVGLHVLAIVPVVLLTVAVASGGLRFWMLIAYGLGIGTITAFVMPARDALLSRVAGVDMMRAVAGMTAVQFGAQAVGSMLAGGARWSGTVAMLAAQATLFAVGGACTTRVPEAARPARTLTSTWQEIVEGLHEVAGRPALRAPAALVFAVGLLFVGPFIVVFPLLVRDVYHGGVDQLALVLTLFPLGTIVGSLVMRRLGGLMVKGRAALIALAGGALALAAVAAGPSFGGLVVATFAWGLCGSVFINCSRTIFQEHAPAAHRARVLSIYQLGFLGAAPLGALAAGAASARIGPLATLGSASALMLAVVIVMWLATETARLD